MDFTLYMKVKATQPIYEGDKIFAAVGDCLRITEIRSTDHYKLERLYGKGEISNVSADFIAPMILPSHVETWNDLYEFLVSCGFDQHEYLTTDSQVWTEKFGAQEIWETPDIRKVIAYAVPGGNEGYYMTVAMVSHVTQTITVKADAWPKLRLHFARVNNTERLDDEIKAEVVGLATINLITGKFWDYDTALQAATFAQRVVYGELK